MRQRKVGSTRMLAGLSAMLAACGGGGRDAGETASAADTAAAESRPAASVVLTLQGLQTPESVRFDPELGVYFVANINGGPLAKDGNGFISRVSRDGKMDSLKFIAAGRGGVTLNGPKGLAIKGDTLWVADIDAVRAFDKRSGKPLATVSLAGKAKFLNDAVVGPDGAIYFTDTGVSDDGKGGMGGHPGPDQVFRVEGRRATIAVTFKDKPGINGIAWDSAGGKFLVVPFEGKSIYSWAPGDSAPAVVAEGPGMMDGIESLGDGRFVVSSWADSSLFILQDSKTTKLLGGIPGPADFALDRERNRIAVPSFIGNRLEFVDLQL